LKTLPESARVARRCGTARLAGLIALLFTGCAQPICGTRAIAPEVTRGYQPGLVTRADIESELGPATRNSPDGRQIAYLWITSTGTGGWRFYGRDLTEPYYAGVRYHAYCAAFDENQRLIRAEFVVTKDVAGRDQFWQEWQHRFSSRQPEVARTP
jgi:hypothetical protein